MAPGGRLGGWHPAREFHHGPELKRSIREAEDTDAVDLSLNSKIKYQDAEKNLREKDMGQLRLLDRRSPDTASSVTTSLSATLSVRPVPRGLPFRRVHPTNRASRVASLSIFRTCRHQYPGGNATVLAWLTSRPVIGLPLITAASASALSFSRPTQCSLAFRPIRSLSR